MSDSKKAIKIIARKIRKVLKSPSENYTIYWDSDKPLECYFWFHIKNGVYSTINPILYVNFKGPNGYFPFHPPNVKFLTPPFHTNVYGGGSICVDIFTNESKWSPENGIGSIADNMILLFNDQNPSSPANAQAGKLFSGCVKEWNEYKKTYKATHKKAPNPYEQDRFFKPLQKHVETHFKKYNLSMYYEMFPKLKDAVSKKISK